MNGREQLEYARSLLELAGRDPRAAVDGASMFLADPDMSGNDAAHAVALRARGLARVRLDDGALDHAVADLDAAVAASQRAGDAQLCGEVRMTQAGVLAFAGDTAGALTAISRAIDDLTGPALARALVQRSTILYREGRLPEARADLDTAAPAIRRAGDVEWLAHLHTNRGIVLAAGGDVAAAERDLQAAHRLLDGAGRVSAATEALHNLGWVAWTGGDLPGALRYFDQAEDAYRLHGHGLGEIWRDRAEALMSAHLVAEARTFADKAVGSLRDGHDAAHAEALLTLAKAAMLAGDTDTAAAAAADAASEFRRQQRPSWATLAEYLAVRVRAAADGGAGADLRSVEAIGDTLQASGLAREATQARLLLLRLAVRAGDQPLVDAMTELAERTSRLGALDLRVEAWRALAEVRQASGDERGAIRAAEAGLGVIDRYRATLGASEMRVAVAGHARELAVLGLGAAYRSGRPERIFRWMERTRAGSLRFASVRPPDDDRLAADLAQIRHLDRLLTEDPTNQRFDAERRRLQEEIRRRSLALAGTGATVDQDWTLGEVVDAIGEATLIEIGRFDGRYRGLRADAATVTYTELADEALVGRTLDSLRFGLSRIAQRRGSAASRQAASQMVAAATTQLQALLLDPLGPISGPVVLVPPAELHAVPWALLPALTGVPVAVSPSAHLWMQRRGAPLRRRRGVVVAHGPRLPGAAKETRSVAAIHLKPLRLTATQSKVDVVTAGLDGASIAHLVAHGHFRTDNPLFSSLEMSDGNLTVYDLERVDRMPPLVVLSACNSGLQAVRPGSETMGIVAALLGAGCRTVVASTGLVPDTTLTARTMVDFHRRIAAGEPPADALATSQAVALKRATGGAAASPFVCFGSG